MLDNLFYYKGVITGVYDGDTVTVSFDLGMKVKREGLKVRLFGINAPELRGDTLIEARESRDFLRSSILNQSVIVQTIKDKKGKYGRYLAKIWKQNACGDWDSINDLMVSEGFASYRQY